MSVDLLADGSPVRADEWPQGGERRRARVLVMLVMLVMLLAGLPVSAARADGDPGSDVLVYQNLFAGSEVGLSVQQQVQLGALLRAASGRGFPIRVAIIGGTQDLGAVTELWREPRTYARFLGYELHRTDR